LLAHLGERLCLPKGLCWRFRHTSDGDRESAAAVRPCTPVWHLA
jgi:hypothetical protein